MPASTWLRAARNARGVRPDTNPDVLLRVDAEGLRDRERDRPVVFVKGKQGVLPSQLFGDETYREFAHADIVEVDERHAGHLRQGGVAFGLGDQFHLHDDIVERRAVAFGPRDGCRKAFAVGQFRDEQLIGKRTRAHHLARAKVTLLPPFSARTDLGLILHDARAMVRQISRTCSPRERASIGF